MTQPGVARFEAGGTTPTIPVLERLAGALGLQLTVALGPESVDRPRARNGDDRRSVATARRPG